MKKYYLHPGPDQKGPFDIEELKRQDINKGTPIWFEGLNDWTTADRIDELADMLKTKTPPPFKGQNTKKIKKNKLTYWWNIFRITALVLIFGYVIYALIDNKTINFGTGDNYYDKVQSVEEIEKSQPTDFLYADGNYRENFIGDKLVVNCVITNKATVATYIDAVVRVTYYTKTKTELESNDYTIYEEFPPTSTKTVELRIDNYKNVNSLGWEIIDAKTKY